MANQDSINLLFGVPEMEKQLQAVKGLVADYLDLVQKTNAQINAALLPLQNGNTSGAGNVQNLLNQQAAATRELVKQKNQLAALEAKLAIATSDEAKEIARLNAALAEQNKKLKENAQAMNADAQARIKARELAKQQAKQDREEAKAKEQLSTAYGRLENAQKKAEAAYREYYLTLGESHPITLQAQKDAKDLHDQLLSIDKGSGNFRRNVGNYSSAFDSLGASMQQILREAPSAAVSLNTFFLAISNNLPTFFDEISKVVTATKELQEVAKIANIELIKQTEIQKAAAAAQSAADDSLAGQIESIIASIAASKEESAALREQIVQQVAATTATAEGAAAAAANAEATAIASGASLEEAAALRVQAEAAVLAARTSLEATAALQAQAIATAEANAQAAAQPSVLARLGKSIFSINTALTLGVLAITLFGSKIIEAFGGAGEEAEEAEKKNKKYLESLKDIERQERTTAEVTAARLRILTAVANDNTISIKSRLAAVKELQETYPATFGALEKQAILEGRLGDAVDKTTKALLDRAAAQAAEKKFGESSERVYDLTVALREAQKQVDKYQAAVNRNINNPIAFTRAEFAYKLKSAKNDYEEIAKNLANARKEQEGFLKDALASGVAAGDLLIKQEKIKKEKPKRQHQDKSDNSPDIFRFDQQSIRDSIAAQKAVLDNEENSLQLRLLALDRWKDLRLQLEGQTQEGVITITEEARKKEIQLTDEYFNKYIEQIIVNGKVIELQYSYEYAKQKQALDQSYSDGLISQKEYNSQLRHLKIETEKETLTAQIESIESQRFYLNQLGIDVSKLTSEYQKLQTKRNELNESPGRQGFTLGMSQDEFDKLKDAVNLANQFSQQIQNVGSLFGEIAQRRIDQIQQEKDAIQSRLSVELDAIQKSTASEVEKQKLTAEANASAQEQQLKLDQQLLAEKRKQAAFDKASKLSAIITGTAVAVTNALGSFPFTPANIALAATVGAVGAAQLAVAAAAPIPQYAEGKDPSDPYTGKAIMGEAGPELLISKDGRLTFADKPTLFNTRAGDTVLSNEQLKQGAALPYLQKDGDIKERRELLEEMREMNRRLSRMKNTVVHIHSNDKFQTRIDAQ